MSDFKNHRTADLIGIYNEWAVELGRPEVSKFQDRETAERRTAEIQVAIKAHRASLAPAPGTSGTTIDVPNPEGDSHPVVVPVAGPWSAIRAGTNRRRLLDTLLTANGSPVAVSALTTALYGEAEDMRGATMMVMKGLIKNVAAEGGYSLTKAKDGKEITFALSKTVG